MLRSKSANTTVADWLAVADALQRVHNELTEAGVKLSRMVSMNHRGLRAIERALDTNRKARSLLESEMFRSCGEDLPAYGQPVTEYAERDRLLNVRNAALAVCKEFWSTIGKYPEGEALADALVQAPSATSPATCAECERPGRRHRRPKVTIFVTRSAFHFSRACCARLRRI